MVLMLLMSLTLLRVLLCRALRRMDGGRVDITMSSDAGGSGEAE